MRRRTVKLHLVLAILLAVGAVALASACGSPDATPTPPPTATPTSTATPIPTPTATPVLALGMEPGQRYHDIHVNRQELQCTFCHSQATSTYQDPLAQVFNPVDRRACLSCHREGADQPFYGEAWQTASVK